MGLLDDAIREHLDLKRRRGADPTEVERAEREALGPVRRSPAAASGDDSGVETDRPPAATGHDVAYDDGPAYDDEPTGAHELQDTPGSDDRAIGHEPVDEDGPSWSYDASEAEPPRAAEPEPEPAGPPLFAEPEPAAEAAPIIAPGPAATHGYADHTIGHDAEEAFDRPAEHEHEPAGRPPGLEPEDTAEHPAPTPGDEDVLEETPEFLQDTPDHDRLWFEQRPPRDFDFDR